VDIVFLTFILILSIFLGFELISKVPATLHTPLMSGANAISGITLAGAFISAGIANSQMANILGCIAVALATVNVVGGYMVTDRMLAMFKSKTGAKK
jgi:NAD(P) transhydrogenase subunit alpha